MKAPPELSPAAAVGQEPEREPHGHRSEVEPQVLQRLLDANGVEDDLARLQLAPLAAHERVADDAIARLGGRRLDDPSVQRDGRQRLFTDDGRLGDAPLANGGARRHRQREGGRERTPRRVSGGVDKKQSIRS